MNIYGETNCPNCGAENYMYRPLENILPTWDRQSCWVCKTEFLHSEEHAK